MKLRRWAVRALLFAAAGLGLFVFGWVPYYLGGIATTRRFEFHDEENGGLTPASFELPFEDVEFTAPDGASLSGWWVPAPNARGSVVLAHGLNRSRIEMVKKVPFLHERGWNALLFDLRHHGGSGGDTSTFGFLEEHDVQAAADFARERSPGPVVVWGVSLGGASVALAAADDPRLAGVICDSSYRSVRDTVRHHLDLVRSFWWWLKIVPDWPVADEIVFWMGRRGGFDPDAVDVLAAARRIAPRPALFVCNSGDKRMPPEIAFELKHAVGDSAHVLVVPGDSHGGAYRDGRPAYERAVSELLDAVSPPAVAVAQAAS